MAVFKYQQIAAKRIERKIAIEVKYYKIKVLEKLIIK